MPRGYRYIVLAAFGVALLGAAPKPSEKNASKQAEPEAQVSGGSQPVTVIVSKPIQIVQPPVDDRPCDKGQEDRKSDLCAQWKAADSASDAALWAMVGTIVASLGTFGLFWQIVLTRRAVEDTGEATRAMRQANHIARANAQADLRPYVHPTMAKIIGAASDGFKASIVFENGGRTPALGAQFFVYLSAEDWLSATGYRPSLKKHFVQVGAIPPEDKRQRSVDLAQIRQAREKFGLLIKENALDPQFVLRGFVKYRDTFDNRYITEFAYISSTMPREGAVKMTPIHMDCPTYQKVDDNDQPISDKTPPA